MRGAFLLFIFSTLILSGISAFGQSTIDLSGKWQFYLDPQRKGVSEQWFAKKLPDSIQLPGSLQEQGYGDDVTPDTNWWYGKLFGEWRNNPIYEKYRQPDNVKIFEWLQPKKHYIGVAWYQRQIDIPQDWKDKRIVLFLERVHWESTLWVDDQLVGKQRSLLSSQEFDITDFVKKGSSHTITLRIDNSQIVMIGKWAHSVSDETQTSWNGMVGKLQLQTTPKVWIDEVQVYPDIHQKSAKVVMTIKNSQGEKGSGNLSLKAETYNTANVIRVNPVVQKIDIDKKETIVTLNYPLGKEIELWDEFNPALYHLTVNLQGKLNGNEVKDASTVSFAMREFTTKGTRFQLNDRIISTRGNVHNCEFPLTGYPRMDKTYWVNLWKLYKDWGLNSVRFHSWCPPEAAFAAADEVGLYMEPEVNDWSRFNTLKQDSFAREESRNIFKKYGNHPSITMMALGNELSADTTLLRNLVDFWKGTDNRRVYSGKIAGSPILDNFQWYEAGQVNDIPTRYHGVPKGGWPPHDKSTFFHTMPPQTTIDWSEAISRFPKPYTAHELGQRCVYPDVINEPLKYTGSLKPAYMDIARDQLTERGMLDQVPAFVRAAGKWQVELYKEEIEANMRTTGIAGFSLLSLQDFPGQSTAPVGLMDVFYETRGYVNAERFRHFCSPVVPLARMKKRILETDETFTADLEMYNFGKDPIKSASVYCTIKDMLGKVIFKKVFTNQTFPIGNNLKIGSVSLALQSLTAPAKYKMEVGIANSAVSNEWNFWVYPKSGDTDLTGFQNLSGLHSIVITHDLNKNVKKSLDEGKTVLLLLNQSQLKGKLGICFADFYWTGFGLFGGESSATGMLCNPAHPVFKYFPTAYHTDWQWWDLLTNAHPMILDEFAEKNPFPKDYRPLIQMIDSWKVNRKMGVLAEGNLGKGKIMICSIDLEKDLDKRPATRQFKYSLFKYLNSSDFKPSATLSPEMIRSVMTADKSKGDTIIQDNAWGE